MHVVRVVVVVGAALLLLAGRAVLVVWRPESLLIVTPVGNKRSYKHYGGPRSIPTTTITCESVGRKHECFLAAVRLGKVPSDGVVIFADDDIIFSSWSPRRVIAKFRSFKSRVVLGTDRILWPNCSIEKEMRSDTIYSSKFPNGGFIMGRVAHLIEMFQWTTQNAPPDDQFRTDLYWLANRFEAGRVSLDLSGKLVKSLSDWSFWHRLPGRPFQTPWYYDLCERPEPKWWKYDSRCVNTEMHSVLFQNNVNCAALYEVDGCRISQRRIANRTLDANEERRATAGGDWTEELDEFLPALESFAYHGNGPGVFTFLPLKKIFESSCGAALDRGVAHRGAWTHG